MTAPGGLPARLAADLAADLAAMLRFYSRLPVPALPFEAAPHAAPDFARAPRMLPLAGAILGALAALPAALALGLGLSPAVGALLAVAATVILTGAFHEDGLADSADGLWGGATRERRLEIMRDSRIGSYGAAALALSLLMRGALMADIIGAAGAAGLLALPASGALSRTLPLALLHALPPARADGAANAVGRPERGTLAAAFALAALICLAAGALLTPLGMVLALLLAPLACLAVARIAMARIGGQTGDILGAAQQLAEIAIFAGLAIGLAAHDL